MEDDGAGYDRGSQALILPQRRKEGAKFAMKKNNSYEFIYYIYILIVVN